jgi:hypothetical protein
MGSISDEFRSVSLNGFTRSGVFQDDIKKFCEFHGRTPDSPDKVGLRLALGEPLTVHQITDGVCKKIMNVKIENLPEGYPQFLKEPFLLEAKQNSHLFDDVHTIGGYIGDEGIFIIIAYCDNSSIVLKKDKPFTGGRLDEINFETKDELTKNYESKARKVFPFIVVLALMLEAEKSPVLVDNGNKKSKKKNKGKNKGGKQADWVERRIYIDAKYNSQKNSADYFPMDKDDKIKREVFIQGFLRHQPYGPKHGLRKWIYVEGFESSRWINKGDKKITIGLRQE